MTPMQVRRRRVNIEKKLAELEQRLAQLQETCTHPLVDKKFGANTGNYDPSADSYWINWRCPDCNKRWRTDQ